MQGFHFRRNIQPIYQYSLRSSENKPGQSPIAALLIKQAFEVKPGNNRANAQQRSFVILQPRNGGRNCARNWLMSALACTRFSMLYSTANRFLLRLKHACRSESDQFREEDYLQAREAFGSLVMGWRSANTINIYDHGRNGEATLSVLADYQNDLSKRCYIASHLTVPESIGQAIHQPDQEEATKHPCEETVWVHDAETLNWIKKLQQAKQGGQGHSYVAYQLNGLANLYREQGRYRG